ncbi:MAG: ribbon-helix-helix protein, CopG family [bacterium]|nr:ribbon-helix-helix protein, CopG family [bacterium]
MRTTIEIPDTQRARLLELAARRGEKGFSRLIQEAIAMYLEAQVRQEERVQAALTVIGTLDDEAAKQLAASVRQIRNDWR